MKIMNTIRIRRALLALLTVAMMIPGCNDQERAEDIHEHPMGDTNGGDDFSSENEKEKNEGGRISAASNPYGFTVAIRSPYSGKAETTSSWAPPSHGIYWGGDWSGDFWKDNGNTSADYGYSCGEDIFIHLKAKKVGGIKPDAIKAKFIGYGYACASGDYSRGGMYQKWEIIAVYNNVDTPIGWVLYAHLDNSPVYSLNTVLTVTGPLKIGRIFSGGITGACWGSCHIHMELYNYSGYSCYSVGAPWIQINRVGFLGGSNSSVVYCP